MFNLKHFKLVKKLRNVQPNINWLNFSDSRQTSDRDKFLNSLIDENKFVAEDMKIRAMVEDMIKKEFPERLQNKESYEYLVDSVVNKLKQQQMGDISEIEE